MGKDDHHEKLLPNFIGVFEQKLDAINRRIKRELKKDKKDRNKKDLKALLREAKGVKKTIKRAKKANTAVCPHCGKEL